MGALYEDVEKFFGDIFALYGRFVGRHPVVFVIVSLLVSVLLGLGLLNMQYENDVERLYTPMGSQAAVDRAHLAQVYPDNTRQAFYPHQLIYHGTFGELFLSPKEENDVLTAEHLGEIRALRDTLLDVTLDDDDRGLQYDHLCALRHEVCVVEGESALDMIDENGCINSSRGFPVTEDARGSPLDLRDIFGSIQTEHRTDNGGEATDCHTARTMRMKYNLKHDTQQQRDLSLLWERKFLDVLSTYSSRTLTISYAVSESLDLELTQHLSQDSKFFALTFVIMVLYTVFVSSGGNWVNTRIMLAQAGILAALLAILATFGLLSMCGVVFVDICGVMPFLILGVGVDDTFILMSGWRQTDIRHSIEDRMADTFRSSAISVTITSLTNFLAFCIGATSPFLSVRNFCIYAGMAVCFCYLNHLTFFAGCMVLHARRVKSSRHCLTCVRTKSRESMEAANVSRHTILCCHGHPSRRVGENDSLCEKIPNTVLPRLLLKWQVKLTVILSFFVYVGISIWGASQIKSGLKIESVVPESSYLSEYLVKQRVEFPHRGSPIMFVINEVVQYDHSSVQNNVRDLLSQARQSGYVDKDFTVSWLDVYLQTKPTKRRRQFVRDLKRNFLPNHPEFANDLKFDEADDQIVSSRFYIRALQLNTTTEEGDMMMKMREIASNSSLPVIAYSLDFIYYEHYVSILKNTLLSVGIAFIGMIFIALMFIPHPISIICVVFSMVTIVLGMFGFMSFWDLELSAITNVQIILSVGFCVDFTVHINHSFLTAPGKNRKERVISTLERAGIPILNGAVSSILGVLILAFARSYVFRSFFKTMLLVIILGLAHSLLLLPVILSFIGPKRTSKPRVFIPISNNWSSGGVSGFFSTSRHPKGQSKDDLCDSSDTQSSAPKAPGHDAMELMKLESSPGDQKWALHPVPEVEEGLEGTPMESRPAKASTSGYAIKTLLDKTPDEEHYRQPVETSAFTPKSQLVQSSASVDGVTNNTDGQPVTEEENITNCAGVTSDGTENSEAQPGEPGMIKDECKASVEQKVEEQNDSGVSRNSKEVLMKFSDASAQSNLKECKL